MAEQTLAETLIEELKSTIEEIKSSISSKNFIKIAIAIAPIVVKRAEAFVSSTGEKLAGTDKRELAIEIINYFLDIPILPEYIESKIIGIGIDFSISVLNKLFGKNWLEKVDKEEESPTEE